MKSHSLRIAQPVRFIFAGSLGVILYYATLYLLVEVAGVWYLAAAVVASVLNISSNFVLQKVWTFESRTLRDLDRQVARYGLMVGVFFCLNVGGLYLLVEFAQLWYLVAQVILTTIITVLSFYLSRRIFTGR